MRTLVFHVKLKIISLFSDFRLSKQVGSEAIEPCGVDPKIFHQGTIMYKQLSNIIKIYRKENIITIDSYTREISKEQILR